MTEPESMDAENGLAEDDIIRGKVIGFLNTREIVMNVGKADGVKIGMQFAVLVPGGIPISIKYGGEELSETLEYPKSVVKVVRLSGEHLSVGRTFKIVKGRPAMEVPNVMYQLRQGTFGLGLAAFDSLEPTKKYPAVPDKYETFVVDAKDTVLDGVDLTVREGDDVRLTSGDEFVFPGKV
jgi:hypothetical protein